MIAAAHAAHTGINIRGKKQMWWLPVRLLAWCQPVEDRPRLALSLSLEPFRLPWMRVNFVGTVKQFRQDDRAMQTPEFRIVFDRLVSCTD